VKRTKNSPLPLLSFLLPHPPTHPQQQEDGTKRVLQELVGRRKLKRGYEYECRWRGFAPIDTTWMARNKLEERGFSKLITEVDVKEAARLGMHSKPLTQAQVEKHLIDLGELVLILEFAFFFIGSKNCRSRKKYSLSSFPLAKPKPKRTPKASTPSSAPTPTSAASRAGRRSSA